MDTTESADIKTSKGMIFSIASGKGGTGKTSLACAMARALGPGAALLDCDVEEPNCALFIEPDIESEIDFCVPVPVINPVKCQGRGRCQQVCEYNAIKLFNGKPFLFDHMCHSCGACALACRAITEKPRHAGKIRRGRSGDLFFADGLMNIGEASPVWLIKAVKALAPSGGDVIIDCPPGTSCPMISAVSGSDFCLLVSEPTPFGLSDLKLAVGTLEKIKIPYALVINRYDLGNGEMEAWCAQKGIKILLKIPFDREIAAAYSRGKTILDVRPEYGQTLKKMSVVIKAGVPA
ncbi:MAG TPA: (4Fe-4S)-binding protein [Elusimicrobia bacterium]|nr:(4Fe-4S)-binding protein [Elusimicrobiota bacterium]